MKNFLYNSIPLNGVILAKARTQAVPVKTGNQTQFKVIVAEKGCCKAFLYLLMVFLMLTLLAPRLRGDPLGPRLREDDAGLGDFLGHHQDTVDEGLVVI